MWFDEIQQPWVAPSLNIPTLEIATIYPGTVLCEGTNISEGRGTTMPFLMVGAPWIETKELEQKLEKEYQEQNLQGFKLRKCKFTPVYSKHEDKECEGIQFHIFNRESLVPFQIGLVLIKSIKELYPSEFDWRVGEGKNFFDLLTAADQFRNLLEKNVSTEELIDLSKEGVQEFKDLREKYIIYE